MASKKIINTVFEFICLLAFLGGVVGVIVSPFRAFIGFIVAGVFFTCVIAVMPLGAIIAVKLALRSYKKIQAKYKKIQAKRKKERKKAIKQHYSTPDKIESGTDSPIDLLTKKAIDGNEMARDLIDTYAELEATASKNNESIEALRGEFMQSFKAMDELLTVHDDMKANPTAYADPHELDEVILKSEASLKESILDKTQSITAKNVVKAKANAAYLTHR